LSLLLLVPMLLMILTMKRKATIFMIVSRLTANSFGII
jgi:hypothetical protein